MKVISSLLEPFHLDNVYCLMNAIEVSLLHRIFVFLDIHGVKKLNDVQIFEFLKNCTNMKNKEIFLVFDTLDTNGTGDIDFEEFYFLVCILVAVKDKMEKDFIRKHTRAVFDLLDTDSSRTVSAVEFQSLGFLFNLTGIAIHKIFKDFDIGGDQELNFQEFRTFAIACTDAQKELDKMQENKIESMWSRFRSSMSATFGSVFARQSYDKDQFENVTEDIKKLCQSTSPNNIYKRFLPFYQEEACKCVQLQTDI